MRITKQEYIKEAFYLKGQYNKLASVRNATSRRLKELAIEEGLLACALNINIWKKKLLNHVPNRSLSVYNAAQNGFRRILPAPIRQIHANAAT